MAMRAMSSEDFRGQLYHSLQGRGILNSLKSQLRNRLVIELKRTMEGSGMSSSSTELVRKSLRVQIADSIVAEYLKSARYEYSLSIFLPEAGVSMDNLCSEEDLFRFLRIAPSSSLCERLKSHPQKPDDFLERLLEALIEGQISDVIHLPSATPPQVPAESPTSHHSPPVKKSVADRLEELDISYARRAEEESMKCRFSVEDRLSTFQHDLEARYKQQLETELSLYRSRELAKARQEEREQHREELAKEKSDLHHMHQLKLEEVKKSEQRMMEKYRRKEQELEAGIYSQRQTLLSELNSLRVKEVGLKREMELDKRAVALEKEQLKALTEQLENNMKAMKTRYEKTAEETVQRGKIEQELQLQSKHAELAKWEALLKIDAENADSLKHENKKLREELSEHQRLLQERAQESAVRDVGALKQTEETLAQFSDYNRLKKKVAELKQQLSFSESKCSELRSSQKQQQAAMKQLQAKLSKPGMELLSLQAEVERLRKVHHKEMLVLEYDNKQLGRQLAAQTEHAVHYQKRLDEQLVQLRSAQREVQDLHFMLERSQPQGGHGSHRVPGKPRKSAQSPSRKTSQPTTSSSSAQLPSKISTPPPIPYHTTPLFREDLTSTLGLTTPNQRNGEKSVSFFDSSGMFLAESRATIERMEKEARQIERNYYDFNYHALRNSPEVTGRVLPNSMLPGPSLLPGHSLLPRPSPLSGPCLMPGPPLSGPCPLPDFDASFPSSFERSSIGTPATPTGLAQTSPSFDPPILHQSESEIWPRNSGTSPELHNPSRAPPGTAKPLPAPSPSFPPSDPMPAPYPGNAVPPSYPPMSLPAPITVPPSSPPTSVPASYSSMPSDPPIAPCPGITVPPSNPPISTSLPASDPVPDASSPPPVLSSPTHLPKHGASTRAHSERISYTVTETIYASTAAVNSLPALSFTLRTPAPAPVRNALSTELSSAGNTTVFPKSTMSLDSWWRAPSEPSLAENVNYSSTKMPNAESRVESGDALTARTPPSISSPELTATAPTVISSSPAVTRLTGATQTPILSTATRTSEEQSGSTLGAGYERVTPHGGLTWAATAAKPREVAIGSTPTVLVESLLPQREDSCGLESPESEERKTLGNKLEEEDGIDPVMLKYMQLVKEKRQDTNALHLQPQSGEKFESHAKDFDIPPLSQDVSSFDGFSNHEDAFEDW